MTECKIEEVIGKTMVVISGKVGSDVVRLMSDQNEVFEFYHEQDCCETVTVEDINGELSWLLGSPIFFAEESTNRDFVKIDVDVYYRHLWTFYRLGTINGTVVIRWYGSSNGYYSEEVSLRRVEI